MTIVRLYIALRSQLRPGDHYSVLLALEGLNVHRDTVVEILHTYLLGLDKYMWHLTHTAWDDKQKELMAIRLQGSSVDGLSIPPIRGHYMVQYRNNLIGKHFKSLQQVGVFHLHQDLLQQRHGPLLLDLWKSTGELGALLFCHTIDDMDTYLEDIEILIGNLLDVWSTIDPSRILQKPKLHILRHIVSDIRNHGPAILYSTEIFECWNAIFRLCSVLSNHHAPSHDIAEAMSDLERFKHQVSGGWWRSSDGTYVCAGEGVQGMFMNHTAIQNRLGWIDEKRLTPGTMKRCSAKKRVSVAWEAVIDCDMEASMVSIDRSIITNEDLLASQWECTKALIAQSKDACKEHSWVFYKAPVVDLDSEPYLDGTRQSEQQVCAGCIRRMFAPNPVGQQPNHGVVIIERFGISDQPDSRLNMPILHRDSAVQSVDVVPAQNILFIFNAQHDCLTAECGIVEKSVQQERRTTRLTQKAVDHGPMQRYFINMHAIHNATLIRRTLPRHFSKPTPYYPDRLAKHIQFANEASTANSKRREDTASKQRERREQNKQTRKQTNDTGTPVVT